jgi:hypothetical protein
MNHAELELYLYVLGLSATDRPSRLIIAMSFSRMIGAIRHLGKR